MTDLESFIKKGGWEGVIVKGKRIYFLAYADDVVLIADEEDDMRAMMARLGNYLEGKDLR